uniref:ceramidase n=1 Tax=Knipowitschia caucasica TaxID=637954 RepID=A0AAV2KZP3_KNICA
MTLSFVGQMLDELSILWVSSQWGTLWFPRKHFPAFIKELGASPLLLRSTLRQKTSLPPLALLSLSYSLISATLTLSSPQSLYLNDPLPRWLPRSSPSLHPLHSSRRLSSSSRVPPLPSQPSRPSLLSTLIVSDTLSILSLHLAPSDRLSQISPIFISRLSSPRTPLTHLRPPLLSSNSLSPLSQFIITSSSRPAHKPSHVQHLSWSVPTDIHFSPTINPLSLKTHALSSYLFSTSSHPHLSSPSSLITPLSPLPPRPLRTQSDHTNHTLSIQITKALSLPHLTTSTSRTNSPTQSSSHQPLLVDSLPRSIIPPFISPHLPQPPSLSSLLQSSPLLALRLSLLISRPNSRVSPLSSSPHPFSHLSPPCSSLALPLLLFLYSTFSKLVLVLTLITTAVSFVKPTVNAYALNCFGLHFLYLLAIEMRCCTDLRALHLAKLSVGLWVLAISCWITDRFGCSFWQQLNFCYLHSLWHILIVIAVAYGSTLIAYLDANYEIPYSLPGLQFWPCDQWPLGLPHIVLKGTSRTRKTC